MLIEISNRQNALVFDGRRMEQAVGRVMADANVVAGEISVAIVDDATIHELNRRYLHHDEPTDVISFVLEREGERLEGEIIVSAETAVRLAAALGCAGEEELLLYVIHGALHLVGYDDATPDAREVMREQEARHVAELGLKRG